MRGPAPPKSGAVMCQFDEQVIKKTLEGLCRERLIALSTDYWFCHISTASLIVSATKIIISSTFVNCFYDPN